MRSRKRITIVMVLCMMVSLCVCGSQSSSQAAPAPSPSANPQGAAAGPAETETDWPTETITIMATGSAGGSADTTCRIMAEGLKKYLGVTVTVGNYPGAGGMNAANEVIYSKPNGYKLSMVVLPNLCVTYLDPSLGRKETLDSFTFVANAVTDPGTFFVKGDDSRFPDFASFIEYAKTNEVTVGTSGVASDDDIFCRMIMNAYPECKITPVHFSSASEVNPAVMGGHIDAGCGNVGDTFTQHSEGEIRILGVAAEERSSFIPEILTLGEQGHNFITGASRGFAFGSDIDPLIAEKMAKAIESVLKDPQFIEKYAATGMEVDLKMLDEYTEFAREKEDTVYDMAELFGWSLTR